MGFVTLILQLLFAILFVSTLITYLRRRDSLSRDVMLIFASVAVLFVVLGVNLVAGGLPEPILGAALALLLAQPLFTLRLVHQLRPVPGWIRGLAIIGYAVTALPMIVVPLDEAERLFTAAGAVFVLTDLTAAFHLGTEARRRVGSARVRLGAAAAASGLLATALGLITLGSGLSFVSEAGLPLAVGAATLYLVAFLPPGWVRKVWSAVATYEFTDELMDGPHGENAAAVWSRLAELARRTTGSTGALVVAGQPPAVVAAAGDTTIRAALQEARLTALPSAHDERRPLRSHDGELGQLAVALGTPYASVLSFELAGGDPGALILLRERPSLFAADDYLIVGSLSRRPLCSPRGPKPWRSRRRWLSGLP